MNLLHILMNLEFKARVPTITVVSGPFCIQAVEIFSAGQAKAEVFNAGAALGEVFVPGAVKGEVCN